MTHAGMAAPCARTRRQFGQKLYFSDAPTP